MKSSLGLVLVALATTTADAEPRAGFTASAAGGLNVGAPYVDAQLGRRFKRARFFELYLDYSYGAAISEFSFQTFGLGERTYFGRFDRFEVFHEALAAFAVSSSGTSSIGRAIGERLLGPVFTQGIGLQATIHGCWSAALVVSTGYPVWLRTELAARYTF